MGMDLDDGEGWWVMGMINGDVADYGGMHFVALRLG